MESEPGLDWDALLAYARTSRASTPPRHDYWGQVPAEPSEAWQAAGWPLLGSLEPDQLLERFQTIVATRTVERGVKGEAEAELAGLVWMLWMLWAQRNAPSATLVDALTPVLRAAYTKVAKQGPAAALLGRACLWVLGHLGVQGAIELVRFVRSTQYKVARRLGEDALEQAFERFGVSRFEVEELAAPDFGLDLAGTRRFVAGDTGYTAVVDLYGGRARVRWRGRDGSLFDAVPAEVNRPRSDGGAADVVKEVLRLRRPIDNAVKDAAEKLESLWEHNRRMTVAELCARYFEHSVMGAVAGQVVWYVETKNGPELAMWRSSATGGELRGLGARSLSLADHDEIRLFHPAELPEAGAVETLLVWRDYLEDQGVEQPFLQLYRPAYRLPLEGIEDHRYAGQRSFDSTKEGWFSDCDDDMVTVAFVRRWPSFGTDARLELLQPDHSVVGALRFCPHSEPLVPDGRVDHPGLPAGQVSPIVVSETIYELDEQMAEGWLFRRASWTLPIDPRVADLRTSLVQAALERGGWDRIEIDGPVLIVESPSSERFRIDCTTGAAASEDGNPIWSFSADGDVTRTVVGMLSPYSGDGIVRRVLRDALLLRAGRSPSRVPHRFTTVHGVGDDG